MAKDNDDSGDPEPDDEAGTDDGPDLGERTEPDSDSPAGGTNDVPDSDADAEPDSDERIEPDDEAAAGGTDDGPDSGADAEPDEEAAAGGTDAEPDSGADAEPDEEAAAGGTDAEPDSGADAQSDSDSPAGVEDMVEQEQPADAEATGAGSDWQAEEPSTADATATDTDAAADDGDAEVEVTREGNSAGAAIVSFLLPGVGNMVNGDTDRGVVILVLWAVWVVLAWGIGFFLIGGLITLVTFGLGGILWILIGLVLSPIELAIHVLAAVDAYQGSEIVDKVTVKVDEVR